ncbi:MAG: hypothetical protein ACKVQA_13730 [Burkholderiales bacterium]
MSTIVCARLESRLMTRTKRIEYLLEAIPSLSDYRLELVDKIVRVFSLASDFRSVNASAIITKRVVQDFGDVLRLHHCFSREPFSKDKFEYALERVLQLHGVNAALAPRGKRGYDIQIDGENFSLKTEAAKAIRVDTIHISKFMELGGGSWGNNPKDLEGLRDQYLAVLEGVQRILILRALKKDSPDYEYELVEIPKPLLSKAATGRLEMRLESRQHPKPGYCYVEENGERLFSLYFDGGGERKLQVKGLKKRHCHVLASWKFHLSGDAA